LRDKEKELRVIRAMLCMQRYSWEQGVAAQALLESGYIEEAVLLAMDAALRQEPSGRLGVMGEEKAATDPAANGEAVLHAWRRTGDPKLKEAADRMLRYLLEKAPKIGGGVLSHLTNRHQIWVDSFYMAPPFLAVMGQAEEAVRQIEGFRKRLWNRDKQMYAHIWDEDEQRFGRSDCWGVGNGWAAAGLVRVIRALPEDMAEEKRRLIGYLRELLDGCLRHQREDGLFHDVLDNPDSFVETNAAQMFAYAIYSAVAASWLDGRYKVYADRMRKAVHAKVDSYGLVRDVCGSPFFDRPGTATEGQAFFLLMESVAH
jgi:rhamnogalacturonyl hydrolase YesR